MAALESHTIPSYPAWLDDEADLEEDNEREVELIMLLMLWYPAAAWFRRLLRQMAMDSC